MSRIALQNGHSTDTPGLLVTPLLEIAGMLTSTRMVVPNGAAFPTVNPPPVNGDLYYRHDLNKLYVYDASAAAWVTGAAAFDELVYGTYIHGTATTYIVPSGINMVCVTINGATVQLPAPAGYAQKPPITVSANFGLTTTVTATGGGPVYGGSIDANTGAVVTASSPRQPRAWMPSPTSLRVELEGNMTFLASPVSIWRRGSLGRGRRGGRPISGTTAHPGSQCTARRRRT